MQNDDLLEQRLRTNPATPRPADWTRLRSRLVERADADGLIDVAYATLDSPVGRLVVAGTSVGVVRLAFDAESTEAVLDELSTRISPRMLRAPARLDRARRELDEYFNGSRTTFELALDWALTTGFRRAVLAATATVGYGQTATYRAVADAAGNPRAVRAAGTALATNPLPVLVPCHRITRSDGGLGGYRGGLGLKQALLDLEGGQRQQLG